MKKTPLILAIVGALIFLVLPGVASATTAYNPTCDTYTHHITCLVPGVPNEKPADTTAVFGPTTSTTVEADPAQWQKAEINVSCVDNSTPSGCPNVQVSVNVRMNQEYAPASAGFSQLCPLYNVSGWTATQTVGTYRWTAECDYGAVSAQYTAVTLTYSPGFNTMTGGVEAYVNYSDPTTGGTAMGTEEISGWAVGVLLFLGCAGVFRKIGGENT